MSNTYPEPYRSRPKDSLIDPSTCYNRECVSYTAWKVREATGKWLRRTGDMNARNWVYRLPENGYKKVSAPKKGGKYVGVLPVGKYGHAVWFESGNTISEYNYDYTGRYGTRKVNLKSYTWFEIKSPKKKSTPKKSSETVAKEIIANKGGWGNNPLRAVRLRAKGYSPSKVQAIVNQLVAAKNKTSKKYYTVQKGDTLSGIANKHKTTWQHLQRLNKITNPHLIKKGQKIRIK